MSENKDLKTIDDALNSGVLNTNDFFEFDSATVEIIFGAAERMAAEIEKKEKIIQDQFNIINRYQATIMPMVDKNYEDFQREIARLKAELEKRPEVVRCVECKHKEWCRKSINKDGHGDMCPLSFCSAGQSRESEEK